ncbi:MAG: hypothetical protein HYZ45_14705, partial [Burkholderiales bacterium]|nr:hypothetical protein [Burkholderiales bacterium]
AAYQRQLPELTPAVRQRLQDLLRSECWWLISSSEALRGLMQMLHKIQEEHAEISVADAKMPGAALMKEGQVASTLVADMQRQQIIVPHVRIAETARALGFCHIQLSAAGDAGMLAALQSNL